MNFNSSLTVYKVKIEDLFRVDSNKFWFGLD